MVGRGPPSRLADPDTTQSLLSWGPCGGTLVRTRCPRLPVPASSPAPHERGPLPRPRVRAHGRCHPTAPWGRPRSPGLLRLVLPLLLSRAWGPVPPPSRPCPYASGQRPRPHSRPSADDNSKTPHCPSGAASWAPPPPTALLGRPPQPPFCPLLPCPGPAGPIAPRALGHHRPAAGPPSGTERALGECR